ncbi:MAG: holo-ACP synthase, partial [Clostridiales bacterium]|nr:holo-ACP synthase [Clostridiales bacterium]
AELERIASSIKSERFLARVFGAQELEYFARKSMPLNSIAAAFAAKEAFGKALGTGVSGFSLNEVQVLHEKSGKPFLALSGKALEAANGRELDVSITHTRDVATAVVIAFCSSEKAVGE